MTVSPNRLLIIVAGLLAGTALRSSDAILGSVVITLFICITAGAFGWLFYQTRFDTNRYTARHWSVLSATVSFVLGFNLANWLEGFA